MTVAQRFYANGTLANVYACDAFGNILAGIQETYSYNAKSGYYYDSETEFYYCLHRYYDPKNGRWLTEDPIGFEGGMNLYGYCGNGPVGSVDEDGLRPSVWEAALMAEHIYGDKNGVVKIGDTAGHGWNLIDVKTGREGLRMGFYSKKHTDGTYEYAVVNRGTVNDHGLTQMKSDWKNNIEQPFGLSADLKESMDNATYFVNQHPYTEITFIGHSKGGAEAAANAIKVNRYAIVFNPSPLSILSNNLYGSSTNYTCLINSYVVEGDVLDNHFWWVDVPGVVKTYLPEQYLVSVLTAKFQHPIIDACTISSQIKNHVMSGVKTALVQKGIR